MEFHTNLNEICILACQMGIVQKEALRITIISYIGVVLGYLNKGLLFVFLLTPAQVGLVNLIISIGLLFAQFANMGSIFTVWKFFPFLQTSDKKHRGFMAFLMLLVGFGILVFTALYFFFRPQIQAAYLEKSPLFTSYYYWVLPIGISYVVFLVLENYLRSIYKNVVSVFVHEIVLRVLTLILLIVYYFKGISFSDFVAIHSLLYVIPTLILLLYLYRIGELNLRISSIQIPTKLKRIMFQYSSFFYINTLGVVLVNSLDVMMIAQLVGLSETGIYATVVFLSSALQIPYKSLLRASSPLVAEYWKERKLDEMKALYTQVSSVSLLMGFTMFLVVWLNVEFLFSFLKPEYASGIWIFCMLMIGRLVDMYFGLNGSIFTTSKKYRYELIFTIVLVGLVYLLNLLFIPWWGATGAAISTSIALIVFNVGRLLFVWFIYHIHPFSWKQIGMMVLFGLTLFVGLLTADTFSNSWLQFTLEIAVVAVFFIAPIYFLKLETDTFAYFEKLMRRVLKK